MNSTQKSILDPLGLFTVAHGKNESEDYIRGASDQFLFDEKKVKELIQAERDRAEEELQKAREEEKERIAEMLSKAGDNKISILDNDNFTGTYWISLNDAYRLITGRQVNHDWEEGRIKKNATVEMVIRKSVNPDHSELDQQTT